MHMYTTRWADASSRFDSKGPSQSAANLSRKALKPKGRELQIASRGGCGKQPAQVMESERISDVFITGFSTGTADLVMGRQRGFLGASPRGSPTARLEEHPLREMSQTRKRQHSPGRLSSHDETAWPEQASHILPVPAATRQSVRPKPSTWPKVPC